MNTNSFLGCLLGGMVGDAIGLPAEGLSPQRQQALFGTITGHRLVLGRGMVSDDTAHALMTAQALVASGGEPKRFAHALAWRLRWWFLSLPPGIGLATARACLKLLVGFPPEHSGVFSAGNGPAMRAAIIGVFCAHDPDDTRLRALIRASTRLTHTDPKAEEYTLRVAQAIKDTPALAGEGDRGSGVSGYIVHTVDAALTLAAQHPDDLRSALIATVALGGDTDTVAAIVGGIVGARVGKEGIPVDWLKGILEPIWTVSRIEKLAQQLAEVQASGVPQRPGANFWPATHLLLLPIVIAHGLGRVVKRGA